MIQMSKKQAEFFTVLILICTVTAAAILLIDFQIKGAILEESNKLRRVIEGVRNGQSPTSADGYRPDSDTGYNVPYPSDMVDSGATRVETASPIPNTNGKAPQVGHGATPRKRRNGPSIIPDSSQ
jgi:hypothetical protein